MFGIKIVGLKFSRPKNLVTFDQLFFTDKVYLIGPNNAGPKPVLFLRVAEIRAGVNRAGVKKAIFLVKDLKNRR